MEDLKSQIQEYSLESSKIFDEISKKVIGQNTLLRDIVVSLFSKWHILIEWAPWLAKTLSVKSLASIFHLDFSRIQFTPDLLPSDLVWKTIYNPKDHSFSTKKWPIFSNFVLADEINRAPSKVQSALLEAMWENQVTIGETTFELPPPFMVLATQNPIEQEGTFSLPEAQLDRFLLKSVVDYPTEWQEIEIMKNIQSILKDDINPIFHKDDIFKIQKLIEKIYVDDHIYTYVKDIVFYTRKTDSSLLNLLSYPLSPRASLALVASAKALAFLEWRDFVLPEDIKQMAYPALRHRIALSYEAISEWISADEIISNILSQVTIA